jgi:uncharacterized protein YodC (DUF2158 family)
VDETEGEGKGEEGAEVTEVGSGTLGADAVMIEEVGGDLRITVLAETCDSCGERVRYWNDDGLEGGSGNASCACCVEGAEACDPISFRPQLRRLIARAYAALHDVLRPAVNMQEYRQYVEVGDVVRLISGGSFMTVEAKKNWSPADPATIACVWIDERGEWHRACFDAKALLVREGGSAKSSPPVTAERELSALTQRYAALIAVGWTEDEARRIVNVIDVTASKVGVEAEHVAFEPKDKRLVQL